MPPVFPRNSRTFEMIDAAANLYRDQTSEEAIGYNLGLADMVCEIAYISTVHREAVFQEIKIAAGFGEDEDY